MRTDGKPADGRRDGCAHNTSGEIRSSDTPFPALLPQDTYEKTRLRGFVATLTKHRTKDSNLTVSGRILNPAASDLHPRASVAQNTLRFVLMAFEVFGLIIFFLVVQSVVQLLLQQIT